MQLIGQNENDVIVISLKCPKCLKEVIRYNSNWRYIWYILVLYLNIYIGKYNKKNDDKSKLYLIPILESSNIYMSLSNFLQISWMHYVILYNFKDHSSSEIWHILLRKCYWRVSREVFSKLEERLRIRFKMTIV